MNWWKRVGLVCVTLLICTVMAFAKGGGGGGGHSSGGSHSGGGYGSSHSSSSSSSSSSKSYSGGGYGSSSSKSYSSSPSSSGGGYGSKSSKSGSSDSSSSSSSGYGSTSKSYKLSHNDVSMPNTYHEVNYPSSRRDVYVSGGNGGSWMWLYWGYWMGRSSSSSSYGPAGWDDIYSTVGKSTAVYTNESACSAALSAAILSHNFTNCPQRPSYIPETVSCLETNVSTNQTSTVLATNVIADVAVGVITDAASNVVIVAVAKPANISMTNSVIRVDRPVVLLGRSWGYFNSSGVFVKLTREHLCLNKTHLTKYGYNPNYGHSNGWVVFGWILAIAFVVIIVILIGAIIVGDMRRTL